MSLFQIPPPTRFDLRFSVAGIPVRVHPLFWVIALIFGAGSNNLPGILFWVVGIFISVLIHELGHALAMRRYGQDSQIILHFAGGLTVPESVSFGLGYARVAITPNQNILISLAGPFAGFFFAAFIVVLSLAMGGTVAPNTILGFIPFPIVFLPANFGALNSFFMVLLWVNIFWGLINLVPVIPLDGGQVTRNILIQRDPWNGLRISLWVSVVAGALMALVGFLFLGSIYMAFLFALLAFQSYQALQGSAGGL
ncbi:MAG: site-2 protease family protein [Anaerolineales bacterium]|jgi:Zn-dependent protease|nr:site-2 protease family protein [Anaerolineales bacterium]